MKGYRPLLALRRAGNRARAAVRGHRGALPAHHHRAHPTAAVVHLEMQHDLWRRYAFRVDLAADRSQLASGIDRLAGLRAAGGDAIFGEHDFRRQAAVEHHLNTADLGELRRDFRVVSPEKLLHDEIAAEEELIDLLDSDEGGTLGPSLIHQVEVIADQGFAARAVVEESLGRPRHPVLSIRLCEQAQHLRAIRHAEPADRAVTEAGDREATIGG